MVKAIARGDFEFSNAQLFQGNKVVTEGREYEDPDYCVPNKAEPTKVKVHELKACETSQPTEKAYERIDPCKLDYMSVYHAPILCDEVKQ